MEQIIKLIVLEHYKLISKIEESPSELGEPDCRLINPYVIKDDKSLEPFLDGLTKEVEFMMSSDKIITIASPAPTILEKYQDLIK